MVATATRPTNGAVARSRLPTAHVPTSAVTTSGITPVMWLRPGRGRTASSPATVNETRATRGPRGARRDRTAPTTTAASTTTGAACTASCVMRRTWNGTGPVTSWSNRRWSAGTYPNPTLTYSPFDRNTWSTNADQAPVTEITTRQTTDTATAPAAMRPSAGHHRGIGVPHIAAITAAATARATSAPTLGLVQNASPPATPTAQAAPDAAPPAAVSSSHQSVARSVPRAKQIESAEYRLTNAPNGAATASSTSANAT